MLKNVANMFLKKRPQVPYIHALSIIEVIKNLRLGRKQNTRNKRNTRDGKVNFLSLPVNLKYYIV